MSDEGRPAREIHRDENGDIFVLVGGMKIAKRGLPDTAYANSQQVDYARTGMDSPRHQGREGNRGQPRALSDALSRWRALAP
jgi:hypothetical protein